MNESPVSSDGPRVGGVVVSADGLPYFPQAIQVMAQLIAQGVVRFDPIKNPCANEDFWTGVDVIASGMSQFQKRMVN